MPVVDGHMATGMIVSFEKEKSLTHTPIVAVTAHAFEYEMIDAVKSGMDDLLTKPLKKKVLLDKVAKILLQIPGPNSTSSSSNSKKANPSNISSAKGAPTMLKKQSSSNIHNPSQLHQSHKYDPESEDSGEAFP